MPLSFSNQTAHGDYKVRGATLPRMGSGEARGRRGSTGTHRVKEAACEQRVSQDRDKKEVGGRGSSKSRQHSGTGWIPFHTWKHFKERLSDKPPHRKLFFLASPSEFGDIFLYSRPSFPSGQTQREPDGANSSSLMSCGDSRTKQRGQVAPTGQVEEVNQNLGSRSKILCNTSYEGHGYITIGWKSYCNVNTIIYPKLSIVVKVLTAGC